ncbi:MAG: prolyl oligopeptidase family serine peptidase [Opitutaceae bacterium]
MCRSALSVRLTPILLAAAGVLAAQSVPSAPPVVDRQIASASSVQVTVRYDYLLALPDGYADSSTTRWPLVVFLHGSGERGDKLEVVKKHGLPKLIAAGKSFPAVVVSPQCPADEGWRAAALEAWIDDLVRRMRIDPDRIYLTGLSMGGAGTWELAMRRPRTYAAIIPICGFGNPERAKALVNLPIWVFHGAKDNAVPLKASEALVDAIKAAGGKPRFTVYPEAEHDSWTETYANDEIYRWLFAQRRGVPEVAAP